MPELPEVETIRAGLQQYLVGHTITNIEIRLAKQFTGDPAQAIGATITRVRRFGKGLVIDLDNELSITAHVKMTGQLIYENKQASGTYHQQKVGQLPSKYTHVIFHLNNESKLYYNDIRQFGWIKLVKTASVPSETYFKNLGPEPLKDFTEQYFRELIVKRKTPIKQLLLQQDVIAGIGNIYANDALFVARIHPLRPANTLSAKEAKALFEAIEMVLQKGIDVGGASEWQYVNALGQAGNYQNFFQVYHKHGQPCPRCGTIIETIRQGGRSSFYCPKCQKI